MSSSTRPIANDGMISLPPRSAVAVTIVGESRPVVVVLVHAIAVRRFDQQVVGLGHHRGVGQHRTSKSSQIAAEQNRLPVDPHSYVGGSEQMAGVDEFDVDPGRHGKGAVVSTGLQLRHRAKRVGLRVEREGRRVLSEAVPVRVGRVFLLQASRVGQHDPAQILRPCRAEDPAPESLRHQARQVTAVIEVRVGQHDRRRCRTP